MLVGVRGNNTRRNIFLRESRRKKNVCDIGEVYKRRAHRGFKNNNIQKQLSRENETRKNGLSIVSNTYQKSPQLELFLEVVTHYL